MKTQPNGLASRRFAPVFVVLAVAGALAVRAALPHENQKPKPAAKDKATPSLPVTPVTVHMEAVQTENSISGQVEPASRRDPCGEIANRIVARPVTQGDRVEAGAVIALLDADAAQTALRQAQDFYAQARASRLQLETDYQRAHLAAGQPDDCGDVYHACRSRVYGKRIASGKPPDSGRNTKDNRAEQGENVNEAFEQ